MDSYHLGVVAHVDRVKQLDPLRALDPEIVNVDDGTLGATGNHLAVYQALQKRTGLDEWLVILEDDAVPVEGFTDQLAMALAVAPTPLVSLYLGTGYPAQYQRLFMEAVNNHPDACWFLHPQLRNAVGYAVHGSIARAVGVGYAQQAAKRFSPEDCISWWSLRNRENVAYCHPCLVDHEDGPTVMDYRMHLGHAQPAGRKRPRKAMVVGTRLQWSNSAVIVRP